MTTRSLMFALAQFVLLSTVTCGQDEAGSKAAPTRSAATSIADLLQSVGTSDILQTATELRQAAESLAMFGDSLQQVSSDAAQAADSTSQNLAAIGGQFDPFGFKTAFLTIQQQNAIIQDQSRMIIQLQQEEIRRLKKEIGAPRTAQSRSRRAEKTRNPTRRRPIRRSEQSQAAAAEMDHRTEDKSTAIGRPQKRRVRADATSN